jgi:glycogen synthase
MAKVFMGGLKTFSADPLKTARTAAWTEQFSWEKTAEQYLEIYRMM